ncbi:unnamed protein product, partial [Clavelina lepadiformis]
KTRVRVPSQAAVSKAITKAEMAWNCRRKITGISVTTSKVEAFYSAMNVFEVLIQTEDIFEILQK